MKELAQQIILGLLVSAFIVSMAACRDARQNGITVAVNPTTTVNTTAATEGEDTVTTVVGNKGTTVSGGAVTTTTTSSKTTDGNTKAPSTVVAEKRPSVSNAAQLLNPMSGGADAEAEALRQAILNTEDQLVVTGTTYYVSPNGDDDNDGTSPEAAWRTLDGVALNRFLLQPGDAVLFERGYIYRRESAFVVRNGVSYGAYGEGEKPKILGSLKDYAEPSLWKESEKMEREM